ncbi:hypothetical protein [Bradyrhizobium sp. th.b2]|uniref:hypothetical protein n=1 Tax=Bradyrhizobium sp. th-b2 TaxID=172088 RepID=UPI000404ED58|nr:hypothetical protein [Bradyrhizobium sp. th.b2]
MPNLPAPFAPSKYFFRAASASSVRGAHFAPMTDGLALPIVDGAQIVRRTRREFLSDVLQLALGQFEPLQLGEQVAAEFRSLNPSNAFALFSTPLNFAAILSKTLPVLSAALMTAFASMIRPLIVGLPFNYGL